MTKRKTPAANKMKALPSESSDLVELLEKSQNKDHESFAEKKAERELY